MTTALLLVLGVALLAWLLRVAGSGRDERIPPPALGPAGEDEVAADEEEEGDAAREAVAISSGGVAFVPYARGVALIRHRKEDVEVSGWVWGSSADLGAEAPPPEQSAAGAVLLRKGDLVGARVRRGDPQEPWLVEALGVDRDYRAWSFETEEAARAAHDTLQRHVVAAPRDEDGAPSPPSDGDYAEALHWNRVTQQELDVTPDEEEPR